MCVSNRPSRVKLFSIFNVNEFSRQKQIWEKNKYADLVYSPITFAITVVLADLILKIKAADVQHAEMYKLLT